MKLRYQGISYEKPFLPNQQAWLKPSAAQDSSADLHSQINQKTLDIAIPLRYRGRYYLSPKYYTSRFLLPLEEPFNFQTTDYEVTLNPVVEGDASTEEIYQV